METMQSGVPGDGAQGFSGDGAQGFSGDGGPAEARSARSAGSDSSDSSRDRRGLNRAIKESLRELGVQLSLLNHSVGGRLDLKATDLECLDLVGREGPLSPSELARRAGLHPATVTGILDRLEQGGWIARERDPSDRRAVLVRAVRGRVAEVARLYLLDSGMNEAMDQILAGYADDQLELVAGFLRRTATAGGAAAKQLGGR